MITNSKTRLLSTSSLFASLIFLATAYLLHIPTGNGYIHLGDTFIYLAACILPTPYAIAAAAIGAGLADIATGAAIWFIPTIIIKSLMALVFFKKSDTLVNPRNITFAIIASIIGLIGYVIAEIIIFGNPMAVILRIPVGIMQPLGSFVCYLAIGTTMDKLRILERIKSN